MLDEVNEYAAKLFLENEATPDKEFMDGQNAWIWAVSEVIKTDDDAIALVLDVRDLPQMHGDDDSLWECDGAPNFTDFVKSAFYGMGDLFEPAVIAKVGVDEYQAIINRRRALADS